MIRSAPHPARGLTATALGALVVALASPATAQTAKPESQATGPRADPSAPDSATSAAAPADIVVTGSRIRGVRAVGSNVIALDQAAIMQEPVTSTADLLRRVPQVVSLGAGRAASAAQNGAANVTRGSGINLRGLGSTATLLLYDGKRLPPQGTQGQYTDPSVLPAIALGRVEVVADGASAIYGSDAIAGVVNFILRRNFDGIELRARSGVTTDGSYSERQASAIVGRKWSSGSVMVAGEYTGNPILYGYDLPFYQDNNIARGGRDLRSTFCNPGTITAGGSTYAIPAGGVTNANVGTLVRGSANRCFYNAGDSVIPSQRRFSGVAAATQDLGDRLRVFADGFYSYRNGIILGTTDTFTATVRNTNPFFVTPVAGTTSETVTYSLLPELGVDRNTFYGYSFNASGGIEAKLFGDFKGTAYYAHGESKDKVTRRYGVNAAALAAALADTNPATALNVFGGANNAATLARIHDNQFITTGATRLDVANVQVDGSLFALPGGRVRVAVGGEYRKEYTFTDMIGGASYAPTDVRDAGTRNVKAVFGELYIPIFGADNATPGLEELSISAAGRYEHYSDFGNTTNPKIGVTYRPLRGVTFRGSYGTSFRAPTFTEVSQIAGGAGLYYDTLPGPNGNLTGIGIAGGNPGLKPETATTYSGGVEIAPTGLPGLVATATYFHINYKNQIQALRGTSGLLTNPLYASFVTFNPTAAQVTALVNSGLPINNAINSSAVAFIADGRRQNLGQSLVSGIDFGLNYNRTVGAAKFEAGVQGSYFTKFKFSAVPGAALTDVVSTINFPQRFRLQGDVGATLGSVEARVTVNHLSGYQNTTVTPSQIVDAYDTVDLYFGIDVTRRLKLSIDVRNLLNRRPPFVDQARGYDSQSANPIPRLISATVAVKL